MDTPEILVLEECFYSSADFNGVFDDLRLSSGGFT